MLAFASGDVFVYEREVREAMEKKKAKKIKKVLREFSEGKLKSSSGKKVSDKSQALAIGYSEAKRGKK